MQPWESGLERSSEDQVACRHLQSLLRPLLAWIQQNYVRFLKTVTQLEPSWDCWPRDLTPAIVFDPAIVSRGKGAVKINESEWYVCQAIEFKVSFWITLEINVIAMFCHKCM